jgi:hypothetical protein
MMRSASSTPLLREPARAFRQLAANPPDEQRAVRANQHDPAPAVEAERRVRHQQVREERDHRHRDEPDRLLARECAAADLLRHQLGDVRADRHHLDAEAETDDEAPEVQPAGRVLERHHDVGGRVPQQRPREDRTASEAIGEKAACDRADEQAREQRRDEARDARGAEQPVRGRRQDAALHEARRDVAAVQQIVEFEEEAEAQQHDELPDAAGGRQAVEAGRDCARVDGGGRGGCPWNAFR